ncbi:hypothetical protein C8R45DRAFT_117172 [Mycena sanguinolenta]|nr:hypothetical protein C8R45DRAFT_117172 [Mycena sanguinolenta]
MTSFPFAWTGPKSFSVVGNTATPRAASSGSGTVDPSSRNVTSGSKNADLHTRSSSPDIVKVKPEIGDVLTVQQETWRLDVVEVKQENWDEGECVPVETTLTLQAQLKEATDLGAKTLQERLEVETALEKSRQECVDMQAALIAERKASEDRHTAVSLS